MKKFNVLFALVLILSMVLSACAPAAPAPVAEAPVAEAPAATEAPTAAPEPTAVPAPDFNVLLAPVMEDLAKNGYGQVASAKLNEELAEGPVFLLDIREKEEIEKDGFIEGAVNIPVRDVLKNLDKLPALDQKIVVYCASGHRGGILLPTLKLLGYTNVRNLQGGLGAWKKAELPTATGAMAEAKAGTAPAVD
jgi:rhodanese-related sulfurtransferase